MKGGRAKPKAGFRFKVQKWPVPESGGASAAKMLYLYTRTGGCQGGRMSAAVHLSTPLSLGRRMAMGVALMIC